VQPQPLYEQIKHHVLDLIAAGSFRPGEKIPSEHMLAAELGASRLTVHRALRELTVGGVLQRVAGVGTFVAQPKASSTLIRLHNIADDIRSRGQVLSIRVHELARSKASRELAAKMEVPARSVIFHSLIVYCADGAPVQIENRNVSPAFAPDYLVQDFTKQSTTDYLQSIALPTQTEHEIQAVLPNESDAKLLEVMVSEPCMMVSRKTWVNNKVTTFTRFLHAGTRHTFLSQETLPSHQG